MGNTRSIITMFALCGAIALAFMFLFGKQSERGRSSSSRSEPAGRVEASAPSASPASATPAAPAPSAPPATATLGSAERPAERVVALESNLFRVELTTRGAAFRHVVLKGPRYRREFETGDLRLAHLSEPGRAVSQRGKSLAPYDVVSTWLEAYLPGRMDLLSDAEHPRAVLPAETDWTIVSADDRRVVMRLERPDLAIERTFSLVEPYQVAVRTAIANRTASPQTHKFAMRLTTYVPTSDEKSGMFRQSPWVTNAICLHGDSLERESGKDLEHGVMKAGRVGYAGVDNLYFLMAAVPGRSAAQQECDLSSEAIYDHGDVVGNVYRATVAYQERQLQPGEEAQYADRFFFGPKDIETLERAGSSLERAVDFGWLTVLCRPLLAILKFLHGLVQNWGVAIILLTLAVKAATLPLTFKSMTSMREMQRVKPLIDDINARYKDDAQKRTQATMELYKNHKVNPFSGCLPVLAQAPVWFALYRTLWRAVELYRSPFFLWYQDLSAPDPYFVLPLLLGATMFIQQKMTPTTLDSAQQKMMLYVMPAMFLVFMLFLPAGLALYSLVNSILTIAQTQTMYRMNPALAPVPARVPASRDGPKTAKVTPTSGAAGPTGKDGKDGKAAGPAGKKDEGGRGANPNA